MTYLHPPPGDVPVIVTKDVGGYVNEYAEMTRLYAQTGREVRLHECRSACTLALSLPNVCVYPDSLLKFHKAYNPFTKVANEDVSEQLMASYPAAVRERLGDLTRSYKVLTGSELIRLGIRDCNRPAGPVYAVARVKPRVAAPEPGFFGKITEAFSPAAAPTGVQVKPQRVQVAIAPPASQANPPPKPEAEPAPETVLEAPLPPPRPAGLDVAPPTMPAPPPVAPSPPVAPPPPAAAPSPPQIKAADGFLRRIAGSAPILASARFAPFPYRMVRKG
jgi:hypothetical protein